MFGSQVGSAGTELPDRRLGPSRRFASVGRGGVPEKAGPGFPDEIGDRAVLCPGALPEKRDLLFRQPDPGSNHPGIPYRSGMVTALPRWLGGSSWRGDAGTEPGGRARGSAWRRRAGRDFPRGRLP